LRQPPQVITYSQSAKEMSGVENAQVIFYSADDIFKPIEWHDKLYIKSRFADNNDYFISIIADDDAESFVQLLKAFQI